MWRNFYARRGPPRAQNLGEWSPRRPLFIQPGASFGAMQGKSPTISKVFRADSLEALKIPLLISAGFPIWVVQRIGPWAAGKEVAQP